MPEYTVTWTIEIEAETPEQAARQARRIQLDPSNRSDHFEVTDEEGTTYDINADD